MTIKEVNRETAQKAFQNHLDFIESSIGFFLSSQSTMEILSLLIYSSLGLLAHITV